MVCVSTLLGRLGSKCICNYTVYPLWIHGTAMFTYIWLKFTVYAIYASKYTTYGFYGDEEIREREREHDLGKFLYPEN